MRYKIAGYGAVKNTQDRYLSMNGQQAGDPERAAEIFMELAESPEPPMHLFLGNDAYNRASEKLTMGAELEKWKVVTLGWILDDYGHIIIKFKTPALYDSISH
jgi:hypothetical protein